MAVVVSVQDFVVVVCIFGSAFLCDVACCCEGGFGMVQGMSWRSPRIFVSGNVEFVCKGCAVSHQGVPCVWPHGHQPLCFGAILAGFCLGSFVAGPCTRPHYYSPGEAACQNAHCQDIGRHRCDFIICKYVVCLAMSLMLSPVGTIEPLEGSLGASVTPLERAPEPLRAP